MKYYIGVDGGSTKTIIAISTENGIPIKKITRSGCSYQSIGINASIHMLNKEIRNLLETLDIKIEDCVGCCIGMPCYGENVYIDKVIEDNIAGVLSPIPVHVVNDVEVGWAGSLECQEGIHINAGTGSIVFGRGKDKVSARCGGWHEFYGDEGSCYWIGRQAMGLFSKQADDRIPKGALYEIIRKQLGLINDFYFTDVVRENWIPYRWKVAEFQMYAYEAYKAGDMSVKVLYEDAAQELASMVKTIKEKLNFSSEKINVSYSGGLFNTEELILEPLSKEIEILGCTLKEPIHTATEGALLLSIEKFKK